MRTHRHHSGEIPLAVLGTYAVGYLAGRSIGLLWTSGPHHEQGLRRLRAGAGELAARAPQPRITF